MPHDADRLRAEYDALHAKAIFVDRSARGRMRFTGAKAGEVLTGLVTNDVLGLAAGNGQYAAALTPKGRIIADPRILAGGGWYLTDVPERAHAGWNALIQKFVNPRLARYTDESADTCDVGVSGPHAAALIATLASTSEDSLASLPLYGHVALALGPHEALAVRVPGAGVPSYDVIAPAAAHEALNEELAHAGAMAAHAETWTVARVEAGWPEWGVDVDDTTIPQEANFDELDAISYSKGCYTGQEIVARVHFRGHVNRHLRGLRGDRCVPMTGAQLRDDTGAEVGDVRTSVTSPRRGPVAIGMVRREVPLQGMLTAHWDGGECRVRVVALPFTD
jgi:folate-binding protein YgfZ